MSSKRLGCSGLSSLHGGLLRLGDEGASVLAVVDVLPCPGGLRGESVDNLHSQRVSTTVGNEKGQTNLFRDGDAEKVDEIKFLVPDNLNPINRTEPAEAIY